jgi:hypothetical protein
VEPSEGREKTLGKLQVRLLDVSELIKLIAPWPQAPLKLSAGLNLSIPKSLLPGSIGSAKAPVLLHIYDVGVNKNVRRPNSILQQGLVVFFIQPLKFVARSTHSDLPPFLFVGSLPSSPLFVRRILFVNLSILATSS